MRWLLVFVSYALVGCADVRAPRHPDAPESTGNEAIEARSSGRAASSPVAAAPPFQTGRASYYSDKLAGRKTANGERYDPRQLTAAHRTLAFGTVVEVSRADGRSVRVRINDRGPFTGGRVIDLSRRAAEELGMVRSGVVDVTLTVVERP
jgi:rare lipoprotein A